MIAALGAATWAMIHLIDGKTDRTVVQAPVVRKAVALNWSMVIPIALLIGLSVGTGNELEGEILVFGGGGQNLDETSSFCRTETHGICAGF